MQSVIMLSVVMLNVIMLNVIMMNVIMMNVIMLSVIMMNVVMLNVFMMNAVMLIVIKLNAVMLNVIMLNVIMMNVIMMNVIMRSVIMLNVLMLNVLMLNVVMLNVIMLNVIMLNVIMMSAVMLIVVAPIIGLKFWLKNPIRYILTKTFWCHDLEQINPFKNHNKTLIKTCHFVDTLFHRLPCCQLLFSGEEIFLRDPTYSVVASVMKKYVLKDEALLILEGHTLRKYFKRSNNPAYSALATVTNETWINGAHKPGYPATASLMNEKGLRYQTPSLFSHSISDEWKRFKGSNNLTYSSIASAREHTSQLIQAHHQWW
jgi:hypothetical protein